MKILINFTLLFIFSLAACKKPTHSEGVDSNSVPPIILSASLRDSIPFKAVKAMNLDAVTGIKIQYVTGIHTSYFEYDADQITLLETISRLPFYRSAIKADTTCRRINVDDLNLLKQKISPVELENAVSFWTPNHTGLDIYECIKPPFKHTLLVNKKSTRIFHRIEFIG